MNQCRYKHTVRTNSIMPSVEGNTNRSTISDGESQVRSGHGVICMNPIRRREPSHRLWLYTHSRPGVLNPTRRMHARHPATVGHR